MKGFDAFMYTLHLDKIGYMRQCLSFFTQDLTSKCSKKGIFSYMRKEANFCDL
jgi:hypothetical protein